jgi:hypothetical protein
VALAASRDELSLAWQARRSEQPLNSHCRWTPGGVNLKLGAWDVSCSRVMPGCVDRQQKLRRGATEAPRARVKTMGANKG